MNARKVTEVLLFLSFFFILSTCQVQYTNSVNTLTVRFLIPALPVQVTESTPTLATNAEGVAGGTSLTLTILTQTGAAWASSASMPVRGKTSIDYSFVLPAPGAYQVSAQLQDGSGNLLSQVRTHFVVPTQTSPLVVVMPSNLLNMVLTGRGVVAPAPAYVFVPAFSPTTYNYTSVTSALGPPTFEWQPYTLTLTTIDPSATVSVTESNPGLSTPYIDLPAGSPSGSSCRLHLNSNANTLTIAVTGADAVSTQIYTIRIPVLGY
jgi:hypothetical protein